MMFARQLEQEISRLERMLGASLEEDSDLAEELLHFKPTTRDMRRRNRELSRCSNLHLLVACV